MTYFSFVKKSNFMKKICLKCSLLVGTKINKHLLFSLSPEINSSWSWGSREALSFCLGLHYWCTKIMFINFIQYFVQNKFQPDFARLTFRAPSCQNASISKFLSYPHTFMIFKKFIYQHVYCQNWRRIIAVNIWDNEEAWGTCMYEKNLCSFAKCLLNERFPTLTTE